MTANALCTTTIGGPNAVHSLFDVQYAVNTVLSDNDIIQLMNPRKRHPSITARYFGIEFKPPAVSSRVRDETGNGFDLTSSATARFCMPDAEPPYLPTLG
jgi:hypothetical protein